MLGTVVLGLFVFGVTEGAVLPTLDPCHKAANNTCATHTNQDIIYCTADGSKYYGLCEYQKAYCDNPHSIRFTGYGENCSPEHPHPTPSHFEQGLFTAIIHGIDDRLRASRAKNISVNVAKKIFRKQDHTNKVYVRNTNCWAYGVDLTSISPWNSDLQDKKAGTLVSPRTVLWTRNYDIKLNSKIRFVDNNNNVVERRVVKSKSVSDPHPQGMYAEDIIVGELDSNVPDTISFAKVMPRDITTMQSRLGFSLPVMSTDQEEKVLVMGFNKYSDNLAMMVLPSSPLRDDFYESQGSVDRGSPAFFIIDNELVLLFLNSYGGAGGGTSINHYFDQINDIMAEHGTGYKLTEVDLTKFIEKMPHIIG